MAFIKTVLGNFTNLTWKTVAKRQIPKGLSNLDIIQEKGEVSEIFQGVVVLYQRDSLGRTISCTVKTLFIEED